LTRYLNLFDGYINVFLIAVWIKMKKQNLEEFAYESIIKLILPAHFLAFSFIYSVF